MLLLNSALIMYKAPYNNTSKELDLDYGKNNFYFEVAAANFNTNWNPAFTVLSGLRMVNKP